MRRVAPFLALFLLVRSAGSDAQQDPPADPWLGANAFPGWGKCLAVSQGQRLDPGDRLVLFEVGEPSTPIEVSYLIAGKWADARFREWRFERIYEDSALWDSIGCYWGLRAERPMSIAHWTGSNQNDGLPLAIRVLSPDAIVVGGRATPLDSNDLAEQIARASSSLPSKFRQPDLLRSGDRYSQNGWSLVRLFLAKAFYRTSGSGAPIDSVHICEVFLHRDQVLATEEYSRVTGEMERAETEPPELDERNWHDVQSQTIGFFSPDGGRSWRHLTVDIGFEGIHWGVWALSRGSPLLWDYYLYTQH